MDDVLSFLQLRHWFEAEVSHAVSVQITTQRGTVAFLEGPIEGVMGFESPGSHGVSIYGAAGAWTLELAEPEFVSATLNPIPPDFKLKQLTIKMHDHWLSIEPSVNADVPAVPGD